MAKYSEAQFENMIKNWFVNTIREIENLVGYYDKINGKDYSNEFYSQNNSYLNQAKNILKENAEGILTTKETKYQKEQPTKLAEELVQKFYLASNKLTEYLRSVHLAEEQLKYLSKQYQADPEIYTIFELDQQYAMQAVDSLLNLYYMIKITGYEITELKYSVERVDDSYSYCGVKIPNKFSISTTSKNIIDDRKIMKLVDDNEPIITEDQIFYNNCLEKHTDIPPHGLPFENSD